MVTGTFADLLIRGTCAPCHATGFYHYTNKDGTQTKTGRTCYRCGGKGFQTHADARRNWGYDQFRTVA